MQRLGWDHALHLFARAIQTLKQVSSSKQSHQCFLFAYSYNSELDKWYSKLYVYMYIVPLGSYECMFK